MTVPSIIYAQYAPQQIKVDSLGIGLSEASNEYMNLSENQYLIVGQFETTRNDNNSTGYNLIVDHEGVAIRTSVQDRQNQPNEYALYVDGDTYITGRMITSNLLVLGGSDGGEGFMQGEGFWNLATFPNGQIDIGNLYYPDKITLGNNFQARSNTHTLNVSRAADRTIDHAQINIDNTQDAQLRIGILGISRESPAVINTPPSTRLEFHMGRDQSYFAPRYMGERFEEVTNPITNDKSNVIMPDPLNVPDYTSIENSPHMMIDEDGNVGVHTSFIPTIDFELRTRHPTRPTEIGYFPYSDTPCLYVSKTSYACNILMWDYESASVKHIDELYVRRLGVTIRADQILPGAFAPGSYTFVSNVSINGPPDERYKLKVYGDANFANDIYVDGTTNANHLVANDAIMLDIASFCNDVFMNRDVIVNQSLRVRGQLFVEALSNTPTGETVQTWNLIDFAAARPGYSNINIMGTGINTPGRLGVGIDPTGTWTSDEVNHQMTIVKRDAFSTLFPNMFEMELVDKSILGTIRAAWIGHPQPSGTFRDGSLLFVTPSSTDGDYFTIYKQNIYFYPGENMDGSAPLILRENNPPTLGVFEDKKVGILTFAPRTELDVRGSITFTEDLYNYNPNTGLSYKLGLWKSQTFVNTRDVDGTLPTFQGLIYQNEEAPYVGVNGIPDYKYGMNVYGGLRSVDGYYTMEDRKVEPWYDARDSNTTNNHVAPPNSYGLFSFGNVGIGVKTPSANLEIKDNFQSENGTTLKLLRSDDTENPFTAIDMVGFSESWRTRANDVIRTFEIANVESFSNASNARLLWGKYNHNINKYQLVVGCNLNALNTSIGNPILPNTSVLTVGGDMSVLGDVNITGQFRVMSQSVTVQGQAPPAPELRPDDVFIGGANIIVTPGTNKAVCIGNYAGVNLTDMNVPSLLHVYSSASDRDILATFRSSTKRALVELQSENAEHVVRFGVLDQDVSRTLNVPFGFLDQNDNPYLAFKSDNQQLSKFVGFNTFNPTAQAHIYTEGYGSNMFKLTKRVLTASTSSAAPHIELEKTYPENAPTAWILTGPDAAWEEKLALRYTEQGMATPEEVFTFTRNGCFGIGNTTPEFALDVTGTGKRGSLRLLNTNNDSAMPQLLFQSGDRLFGGDESFDYRMYTSNNGFTFDMQNVEQRLVIWNVDSNGHIGIRTDPSDIHEVTVNGALNIVNGTMLINGSSFLEGTQTGDGVNFRATNLFFRPNQTLNGGVVVNNRYPTCNLFHIFSGVNCNLLVLDSTFDECQMHFRCMEGYQSQKYNMYRFAQSNQYMYLSMLPDCGNRYYVDPSQYGYSNAMVVGPIPGTADFAMNVMGQVNLVSSTPKVLLGDIATIGGSVTDAYVQASLGNIGIGTSTPLSKVHVYGSNATIAALQVEQGSDGDIVQFSRDGSAVAVVNAQGYLGIGTSLPLSSLHVADGQILAPNGSVTAPGYSFASSASTGVYKTASSMAISTNGEERIRIGDDGQVMIGSNTTGTMLTIRQESVGDMMHVSSTQQSNAFLISASGNVGVGTDNPLYPLHVYGNVGCMGSILPLSNEMFDLGSTTIRWRDLYLSGTTLDIGGTELSRIESGHLKVTSNNGVLSRVIMSELQLGDDSQPHSIVVTNDSFGNITFEVTDNQDPSQSQVLRPIFEDTENNSITIGDATVPSALSVATNHLPGLVIQQYSPCNFVELYYSNELRMVVDTYGRIGIGTDLPQTYLDVYPISSSCNLANFADQVYIDRYGNVGIHTTVPEASLHIVGDTLQNGRCTITHNVYIGANLEVYGNTVTHGNSVTDSDIRLKSDLVRIESALDKVCALTGYTFQLNALQTRSTGLVAQDVQQVLPEAVHHNDQSGYLGVAYGNMIGLIVEAIKELRAEINEMKK